MTGDDPGPVAATHPAAGASDTVDDPAFAPVDDTGWIVRVDGDGPWGPRVAETLLTVADGHTGTRGTPEEDGPGHDPLVMVAGVFDRAPDDIPRPLPGPRWFTLGLAPGDVSGMRRWLDLRTGTLHREDRTAPHLRSVRFACLARPGTQVSRTTTTERIAAGNPLAPPDPPVAHLQRWDEGRTAVIQVVGQGGITAAASTAHRARGDRHVLDRVAVVRGDPTTPPPRHDVLDALHAAERAGVDALFDEQRRAWAARWDAASVTIVGDPDLELAVRFGLFHLMASVADRGEAAVGARGLSGSAYAGHVFWDADVFVLPFLAATHPPASRAMLEYRRRRLGAARERARSEGRSGARFPWESAGDGTEVAPTSRVALDGSDVPIRTGEQEVHVVADVAWAAWQHAAWTGDSAFLAGPGRPLLLDTAAYWASRIERDADGSCHVRGVIGPDEYHEDVDDNAYTNVMARWNLRRAAELVDSEGDPTRSAARWRELADRLVDGHDPDTRRHEQFAGYDALEPLLITDVADPPIAADVLLGPQRLARTQVIKQADVLMLHHLVPDELPPGSLVADLDHYAPRTAHGSSLSPPVHASLLARAGRPDEARRWLRLAARLDLDDRTGTTAGGLHLATMGGVWQALAVGFLGLRAGPDALQVDPRPLPPTWERLELRVRFHDRRVQLGLGHDRLRIEGDAGVPIALVGPPPVSATTPVTFTRHVDTWEPEVHRAR